MCPEHWAKLPQPVQRLIWHHYREGQEIDKSPTVDYIAAAFVAISLVALEEKKRMPTLHLGGAMIYPPQEPGDPQSKLADTRSTALPYPD
jgi:hypothetical protein